MDPAIAKLIENPGVKNNLIGCSVASEHRAKGLRLMVDSLSHTLDTLEHFQKTHGFPNSDGTAEVLLSRHVISLERILLKGMQSETAYPERVDLLIEDSGKVIVRAEAYLQVIADFED